MADAAGNSFVSLLSLMARLRGEGGCPWDREQTRASLKPYLVEETYEVLEAIDDGDAGKLCEELGDVLLQVVFHADIARERGAFALQRVIERVSEKMVRRHPHVFAGAAIEARQLGREWEAQKARERNAIRFGTAPTN